MMRRLLRWLAVVFGLGMVLLLPAQDMHFSHPQHTGIWLSPAESGLGGGQYRFVAGHRNQWAVIAKPYESYHFSFDGYFVLGDRGARLGYGLLVYRDQAGDLAFGTTSGNLYIAFSSPIGNSQHRLSLGAGGGLSQRSLDLQRASFDENYDGAQYNPLIGSSETLPRTSFGFWDMAAGLAWEFRQDRQRFWKAGTSVWHLNRPGQSFFYQDSIPLDMRYTTYLQHGLRLDRDWYLRPEVLLSLQGPYREWVMGTWLGLVMDANPLGYTAIEGGVFTRAGDAISLGLAGERAAWRASMIYDINYSGLRSASRWRGGWEINILYILNRSESRANRVPACLLI